MIALSQSAVRDLAPRSDRDALLEYENVFGHAVGLREEDGQETGEVCVLAFVEQKQPESELRDSQLLPSDINGVQVDVQEREIPTPDNSRSDELRPATAGANINDTGDGVGGGSLAGAFVDESGERIGLTCKHVVCDTNSCVGTGIVQPGGGTEIGSVKDTGLLDSSASATENLDVASFSVTNTDDISSRMFSFAAVGNPDYAKVGRWYMITGYGTGFYGVRCTAIDATITINYTSFDEVTQAGCDVFANYEELDLGGNSGCAMGYVDDDGLFRPTSLEYGSSHGDIYALGMERIEAEFTELQPATYTANSPADSTVTAEFELAPLDVRYDPDTGNLEIVTLSANVTGGGSTQNTTTLVDADYNTLAETTYSLAGHEYIVHTFAIDSSYEGQQLELVGGDGQQFLAERNGRLDIGISSTNSPVTEGQTLEVTVALENTDSVERTEDVELRIR